MMKSAFRCVQIVLLFYGVFGADEDEVKAVSVMEGDSVTINPDLTQIKTINLLEWKFGDPVVAHTDGNDISYPSYTEIFRGRLQLDLTGSLTIKNMKTKHSGLYQLQISHSAGTAKRKFNVTVYESPSVIDAGKAEMKSVSVKEGDRVTLQTGVTPISGDELIVWRFGDEGKLIAKADKEAKSSPLYYDERFRDRLELDQTGSLIITDTRSTDSGFYSVKISSRTQTVYKRFTVTVIEPGLSPGGKAGIVLVFLAAVVAAAAVGFIYYRRKISELRKQTLTVPVPVTGTEGEYIILKPNKEIQKCDVIQWMFGEGERQTSIAKFTRKTGEIIIYDDAADGRFRDTLELDKTTGSLTIRNSRPEHSGLYTLYITSSSGESQQRFIVTVSVPVPVPVTGTEGEYIILKPNKEIQKGDVILWMFGEGERQTSIAKLIGETGEIVTHDYAADGRFRDILVLDKTTGSLTIRNSRPEHSGLYTLYITSSSGDSQQRFIVTVSENEEEISVDEGGSVTLKPDTEIQRDDQIQWIFEDQNILIAQIRGGTGEICIYDDVLGGRFRGRLKLEKTGSLIITNITAQHTGLYKLKTITSRGTLCKRFRVYMRWRHVFVIAGKAVHLSTDRPKIERDDVIQWRFGDENSLIAEIKGGTGKTHDERFRDRLQLDKITGDLTIKSFTDEDAGDYNLNIRSSKGNTNWTYGVIITVRSVFVTAGESVHLSTDRPEIERDDEIQWRFGDKIIAEIKGGTGKTHDVPDERFRDRLELNYQTGDLTIKNSTIVHGGRYNLKIRSRKGNTNWTYNVIITVRSVYVTAGESVHLSTDRPEIERDDEIEWRFGGEIIAEIKGGTGKTHDGAAGRFRDRLELDDRTGDLTIKNSTAEDDGDYKLKIISSKGNTNWTYSVIITGSRVPVTEGESVRLPTDRPEIERDAVVTVAIKPREKSPVKGNNDESIVEMQPLMDGLTS